MSFLETHATELVGYLAMLVLLISFLMKDIMQIYLGDFWKLSVEVLDMILVCLFIRQLTLKQEIFITLRTLR